MKQQLESWRLANLPLPKAGNPWFMALLLASILGTMLRVYVLTWDVELILQYCGSDALFEYTQIAHHWVTLGFPSFDGTHVTNGVQPLFTWCLMPFAAWFDGNPQFAIRTALGLNTLFTLLLAWQLPPLMRTLFGPFWGMRAGTCAAAIWLLHPKLLDVTLAGTEASLAALCWVLSLRAWARYNGSPASSFKLGLFLGLGCLARFDHVVLAIGLLLLDLKPVPTHFASRLFFKTSGLLVILLPWLVYSAMLTGSPWQDSARAERLENKFRQKQQWTQASQQTSSGESTDPLPPVASDLEPVKAKPWFHIWVVIAKHLLGNGDKFSLLSLLGWTFLLLYLLNLFRHRPPYLLDIGRGLRYLDTAFESAVIILIVYGANFGQLERWDYVPAFLVISILAGLAWTVITLPRWRGKKIHNVTALFCCWLLLAALEYHQSYRFSQAGHAARAAVSLQILTPPNARIGAFSAGVQSAFASRKRQVVNLSGGVNHRAYVALREKELVAYLETAHIDFLIGRRETVALFEAMGAPGLKERLILVDCLGSPGGPGKTICLWRIRHPLRVNLEPTKSNSGSVILTEGVFNQQIKK